MDNKQNLMNGSREIGQNDNIRVKMDKFWSKKGQKLFFDSLLVVFLPVVIKYFLKPSGVPNVKKLVVFVKFMYSTRHPECRWPPECRFLGNSILTLYHAITS